MTDTTRPQLTCGTERIKWVRGMTDLERFSATGWDVDDEGCWIWRGQVHGRRAKFATVLGNRNAARVLWETLNGTVPNGHEVRHKCDQPACINPDHLELGTREENLEDSRRRGRKPALGPDQVARARGLFDTGLINTAELARCFNVGIEVIRDVLERTGAYRDEVPAVSVYEGPMWLVRNA